MPNWSADARIIMLARALRSFGYGMMGVVLGVALQREGFSPGAIGAIVTVSLIGDFVSTYLVGLVADRWGRRRVLSGLAVVMALTGIIFGSSAPYAVLLAAAFFGTLGTTASETAPFLPLEQAMLAQVVPVDQRTDVFARYNLGSSFGIALGSLAAGTPDALHRFGLEVGVGIRLLFGVYTAVALAVALLVTRLGAETESGDLGRSSVGRRLLPPLGRSRGVVYRLSTLFAVDALAGGLVVQSLMALYFHLRYGVSLAALGALFFGANLISALSYLAAARLARRFGLLNTMVFTHLPANLLLILVPFMPTFPLAAAVLLLRQTVTQMDVPTRQAYTMAMVEPGERTASAAVTSLARSAGSSCSPVASGYLLQAVPLTLGLPFIIAGALKSAYDLSLWAVFRRVPIEGSGQR